MSPLCESYVSADRLNAMEPFYPLHGWVCHRCYLVQLEQYVSGEEIFRDYAYFSSYSDSWLAHARRYVGAMIDRLDLGEDSHVVEIASNDGYLLQYFVERGIPCLGIEPAANVARVAEERGVSTRVEFFGRESAARLAREGLAADLLVGNNVLAQVHDLNDFVAGIQGALSAAGVVTIEFPHLVKLVEENQFDTIYHEHFSYFSFLTAEAIFAAHQLTLFDVEELQTHGGSLRIYGRHSASDHHPVTDRVAAMREREIAAGLTSLEYYASFGERVRETKRKLLDFLIARKREGKRLAGYGAPGKGNTLLNYCGIGRDFLDFTVDRSPHKQGLYLPGTHIPIYAPEKIFEERPDCILILPWNIKDEIVTQLRAVKEWGAELIVPIPEVAVVA